MFSQPEYNTKGNGSKEKAENKKNVPEFRDVFLDKYRD